MFSKSQRNATQSGGGKYFTDIKNRKKYTCLSQMFLVNDYLFLSLVNVSN